MQASFWPRRPGRLRPVWSSTVVEHHRLRQDLAVVRLIGEAVPFAAGQSVLVRAPQNDGVLRRYSPALPPSLDGKLEFHVRMVPGGWMSSSIVSESAPGDVWQISDPVGEMHVDDSGRDVVMVAGGTGLAPFLSLILDVARRPDQPRVYLFVGGRSPRDLYASDMLFLLAQDLPFLTVIPVVEHLADPPWPDEWYEQCRVDIGLPQSEMLQGTLADVLSSHGAFVNHQILVCGSPVMVRSTVDRLIDTGTPKESIQHD
ncbi:MAG: oxidoreductase [Mycobacteriaceae bacterium]|nr:oxidoreductase [Mycobacteriaceae bacterium]